MRIEKKTELEQTFRALHPKKQMQKNFIYNY